MSLNYFVSPDCLLPRTAFRPSSRLFKAHHYVQSVISNIHDCAKEFARCDKEKKSIAGQALIRYAEWEMLSRLGEFKILPGNQYRYQVNGKDYYFALEYIAAPGDIQGVMQKHQGWAIFELLCLDDNTRFELIQRQ